MIASRPRFLRPSVLALLPSGLWAVDEFHPVAAVLDPHTGAVRRTVSWSEVPPPRRSPGYFLYGPPPIIKGDGTGLWVQYDLQGPLARIDDDGLGPAARTDGLELSAVGRGVAWCATWRSLDSFPPGYQAFHDPGRLLRVDRSGNTTTVDTTGRIEHVGTSVDGLLVQMAVPRRPDRKPPIAWLSLPWDDEVPDALTFVEGVTPEADEPEGYETSRPPWDGVGEAPFLWHEPPPRPHSPATDHHRWSLGWGMDLRTYQTAPDRRLLLASAHTDDGAEARRWELGRGQILSARSLGDRLAVSIQRTGDSSEVVALHPGTGEVTVLMAADALDITELGWPMVDRPVAADSYVEKVRAREEKLEFSPGLLSDVHTSVLGEWPDTQLEWTFRWYTRPGLRLRYRVRLFDQLGRIDYPEDADLYLMETVESNGVPPAEDAVDGFLDL